MTQSAPDAEDITQDCFLALIRKPGAFDPARAQLRTWLIAVVRRQFLGRSRRSARDSKGDGGEEPSVPAGAEVELIRLERADAVRQAMNALTRGQREAPEPLTDADFVFEYMRRWIDLDVHSAPQGHPHRRGAGLCLSLLMHAVSVMALPPPGSVRPDRQAPIPRSNHSRTYLTPTIPKRAIT